MTRGFTVDPAEQGTPEWHAARAGRLTASRAGDVLATIKSGEAAARRDYRMQLVVERLTGLAQDAGGFVSADMKRGTELEPLARAAYESRTGEMVEQVGFCKRDDLLAGGSPDGMLDDWKGLVEFKAPRSANHLRYFRAGVVPSDHLAQLTALLWVTGATWIDFVSFDPTMPEALQLFVARLERQDAAMAEWDKKARAFLAEVDAEVDAVRTLADPAAVMREAVTRG